MQANEKTSKHELILVHCATTPSLSSLRIVSQKTDQQTKAGEGRGKSTSNYDSDSIPGRPPRKDAAISNGPAAKAHGGHEVFSDERPPARTKTSTEDEWEDSDIGPKGAPSDQMNRVSDFSARGKESAFDLRLDDCALHDRS
jgi:hypothetical protein